jgi:hypothetical protein
MPAITEEATARIFGIVWVIAYPFPRLSGGMESVFNAPMAG